MINDGESSTYNFELAGLTQNEPSNIDASNPSTASESIKQLERTVPGSKDLPSS